MVPPLLNLPFQRKEEINKETADQLSVSTLILLRAWRDSDHYWGGRGGFPISVLYVKSWLQKCEYRDLYTWDPGRTGVMVAKMFLPNRKHKRPFSVSGLTLHVHARPGTAGSKDIAQVERHGVELLIGHNRHKVWRGPQHSHVPY